jgi:hypothetical protein
MQRGRFAVAAAAAVALVVAPASAQTAGNRLSLGDMFAGPDSIGLKPSAEEAIRQAAANANSPLGCPLQAWFKVIVPKGEQPWQEALASARRDVIREILKSQLQPNRFEVSGEVGAVSEVSVEYARMRDREPPRLHTTSVPPKGSRVWPGQQITVTMEARDDDNAWQTGMESLQLLAQEASGDVLVGAEHYRPTPRANCEGRPEPRRLVLVYTVPRNPPPIVRLKAIAQDFANLSDFDIGEFPTREMWRGYIKLERDQVNPRCSPVTSETEFTIEVADDGQISGVGTFAHSGYTCQGVGAAPATLGTIKLAGEKRQGEFAISVSDWEPKSAFTPRIPIGHWIVEVAQRRTAEATFSPPGASGTILFRVALECQTCGEP